MRRFSWPLQRLLDLEVQKEQVIRGQLLKLAKELRALRLEVHRIREEIALRLRDMSALSLAERLKRREPFLRWSLAQEGEIVRGLEQIRAVQEKRAEVFEEYRKIHASRRRLERLREESHNRYRKQYQRAQQLNLDEAAQGAHARRMIQRRLRESHEVTS